jgi:hypothetical protein
VATHNASVLNCTGGIQQYSQQIVAVNSVFDDNSCDVSGSGNRFIDPQLGVPATNVGLTSTISPLAGSPLIDAGDDASCLPLDQRGLPRPTRNHCDIGAVELQ